MNKTVFLRIINPILALAFIVQAGTGIFNDFIPYEIFSKVHSLIGTIFVVLVAIHIVLNWSWIKHAFFK